jgi:hypothetical protein
MHFGVRDWLWIRTPTQSSFRFLRADIPGKQLPHDRLGFIFPFVLLFFLPGSCAFHGSRPTVKDFTTAFPRWADGRFIFLTSGHGSDEAQRSIKLMRCLHSFSLTNRRSPPKPALKHFPPSGSSHILVLPNLSDLSLFKFNRPSLNSITTEERCKRVTSISG